MLSKLNLLSRKNPSLPKRPVQSRTSNLAFLNSRMGTHHHTGIFEVPQPAVRVPSRGFARNIAEVKWPPKVLGGYADYPPPTYVKSRVFPASEAVFNRDLVGSIVELSAADIKKFLPEGVCGKLPLDLKFIGRDKVLGLLVRKELIDIIEDLEQGKTTMFTNMSHRLLTGPPGTGRTALMLLLVYWARNNGYLVVNIPNGLKFVGGPYMVQSKLRPGQWDQIEVAHGFLTHFYSCHYDKLKLIKLKTPFQLESFHRTENSTLAELVQLGIKEKDISGEVVYNLRQELNFVTEFPVLLAIDQVNGLYGNSPLLYDPTWPKLRLKPMSTDKMTLPTLFKNYRSHGLINGAVVGAVSHLHWGGKAQSFMDERLPEEPPGTVVEVAKWSKDEFSTIMNYYEECFYFKSEVPGRTRDWIYYVNDGVGAQIYEYTKLL